jgi:hypothetical protein
MEIPREILNFTRLCLHCCQVKKNKNSKIDLRPPLVDLYLHFPKLEKILSKHKVNKSDISITSVQLIFRIMGDNGKPNKKAIKDFQLIGCIRAILISFYINPFIFSILCILQMEALTR